MASKYSNMTFQGYRRENGRVGVRNHVLILPVDDISNAACEAVANNIKGTLAIPHAYGRLQFGEDLELHFRTIIGTGANPNVAAVVVIGIEPGWTKKIVDGIAATGKPVTGLSIEQNGDLKTIMEASKVAKEYVHFASELQREECSISELWVSTKCGESDTTTGLSSCPTVGNMYDKLLPRGYLRLLRGDLGNHRRRAHLQDPRHQRGSWRALVQDVEGLSGRRHLRPPDR
jgi:(2R)-sulfolactate sulfo-lyase subunit beta